MRVVSLPSSDWEELNAASVERPCAPDTLNLFGVVVLMAVFPPRRFYAGHSFAEPQKTAARGSGFEPLTVITAH
jgi:hypothetical protein